MTSDDLRTELAKVDMPLDTDPGRLQLIRKKYFETIFTSKLYNCFEPDSQKALSKSAVLGVAVNLEGLAYVSGQPISKLPQFIRMWQDRAFVYPDTETATTIMWSVYGLLRSWLIDRLTAEDQKLAHKLAGNFLNEVKNRDGGKSLGLSWLALLQETRSQYL
jgi:hypothetical protein